MELSEFLLARIAEDQRLAVAAQGDESGQWHRGCEETGDGENAYWTVEDESRFGDDYGFFADLGSRKPNSARAEHIARHDPARVLADCEAKRAIVREHEMSPFPTLALLAQVYASHRDYQPDWRP